MNKVLLITGAGGFIGSNAVKYFSNKGWKVKALLHKGNSSKKGKIEYVVGDIRDRPFMQDIMSNVGYVLHLAARKSDERDSYQINVLGTKNLVEVAMFRKVKKIVNISTSSTKIKNKGVYAKTKSIADSLIGNYKVNAVTLRPSIVYGDFENGIFGTLAQATTLPMVPVFGNGKTKFWPIYIEDLMKVIEHELLSATRSYKIYDVGGPTEISFEEIIAQISRRLYGNRKSPKLLKIPVVFGIYLAKILKLVSSKPMITESNVLGTQDIEFNPINLKTKLMSFEEGLKILDSSKLTTQETIAIMRYVTKDKNLSKEIINNFIIAQKNNLNTQIICSPSILKLPWLLGPLDALSSILYKDSLLQKKIIIASALYETSKIGSSLLPKTRGLLSLGFAIVLATIFSCIKFVQGLFLFFIPGMVEYNV